MVVARASGTLIASSLEQNKFWTLELCPAGVPPCFSGRIVYSKIKQNLFRFNLDAMSVPEALETTIRSLSVRSVVLARPLFQRAQL